MFKKLVIVALLVVLGIIAVRRIQGQ